MTLIYEPRVEVIAATQFRGCKEESAAPWMPDTRATDAEDLIELAGRSCYRSWKNPGGKTNSQYIAHILEQAHYSVLEHASVTLWITGISRSLSHELVRHRHFSFCLGGDTVIYQDTSGRKGRGSKKRTLKELWEMWQDRRRTYVKTMQVRTINSQGIVDYGKIASVIYSGEQELFQVHCANGMAIQATAQHRFFTPDGWKRLLDLQPGDAIMANGKPIYQDRDWLSAQVSNGRSTPEIAALVGVEPGTIRKWRRLHGVSAALGSGTLGKRAWNRGLSVRLAPYPFSDETCERIRQAKTGDANPGWKGGPHFWANGNAAANELYAAEKLRCQVCGEQDIDRLQLHHKDGNSQNNEKANIAVLCVPCHRAVHTGTPPKKIYATEIISIESIGIQPTYDLEMASEPHAFVANGLIVHNSQESQRFVPATDVAFVVPPAFHNDPVLVPAFQEDCANALGRYQETLRYLEQKFAHLPDGTSKKKQAREAARAILPNATETRITVSGNLRSWREFVAKRATLAADAEICRLAVCIFCILQPLAPAVWQDMHVQTLDDREIVMPWMGPGPS